MSKRWKHQIFIGLFFTLFSTFSFALLDIYNTSLKEVLLSKTIYIKFLIFLTFGIFILGYFSWKTVVDKKNDKLLSKSQRNSPEFIRRKRWKYQISFGFIFAMYLTFMTSFINNKETYLEQIKSFKLYYTFFGNLLIGIFIIGYLAWKGNDKKSDWNSWSALFKRIGLKKIPEN